MEAAETAVGATEAGAMEVAMEVVVTAAETVVRRSPRRRNSGQRALSPISRMSTHQSRHRVQQYDALQLSSAHTAPIPKPGPGHDRNHYGG